MYMYSSRINTLIICLQKDSVDRFSNLTRAYFDHSIRCEDENKTRTFRTTNTAMFYSIELTSICVFIGSEIYIVIYRNQFWSIIGI